MGPEAISRGPRGGTPVRSNRREVRRKEAAEDSGEEMLVRLKTNAFCSALSSVVKFS